MSREPYTIHNDKLEATGTWVNGTFIPAPGYAWGIEAKIEELEPAPRKPFGVLDYLGLGVVAIILVTAGYASVMAFQDEKEAAERPRPVIQLPPGYRVIDMPPGQIDVVTFCDGPNRVYRDAGGSRGEAISVSPNDPSCKE